MKKIIIGIAIMLIAILTIVLLISPKKNNSSINEIKESDNMEKIKLKVNNQELDIVLTTNSSAKAFKEKLKEGSIIIDAHDYGNFEKVGSLGFSLPTNDERITTEPGDVILYQGNQITIYYDTNSWSFTRLGKIENIDKETLKNILGKDNVTLEFYLEK